MEKHNIKRQMVSLSALHVGFEIKEMHAQTITVQILERIHAAFSKIHKGF